MFSNVYASEVAGPPRPAAMKPTSTPTPTATPKATATPKPTSTPVPTATPEADEQNPADQGTLSKPNHPDTVSADKLVFIGDSRTEGLRDAVNDDSVWSCLSSMGYDWMVSTGVPQVEDQIEDNTAVIILMGVNDLYHVNDYLRCSLWSWRNSRRSWYIPKCLRSKLFIGYRLERYGGCALSV